MLGAITGDVIGSVYEHWPVKRTDFPLFHHECAFTDDTVLTVAIADALLDDESYASAMRRWARRFPTRGYGIRFARWFMSADAEPYNSFGNGSAMRVSPIAWWFSDEATVLEQAERSAACTHDHEEGVRGARATALAIFLARTGATQDEIRSRVAEESGYALDRSLDAIRPEYGFDVTCQGSVPEALIAFLEADSVEGAVRNAISLGGDADTQAAIAGSIAEAAWGVPDTMAQTVLKKLPDDMKDVIARFRGEVALRA
ncbi:ADP-ribosylglycohydrolase family protein [Aquisalimonas asiatica]|uniref:ADP-ribosylglycohydrolase n=1 Tax=Aquisalimonas asiatica TaxID=406100 RepID=A0A1H8QTI3_9GAMM|nr:ADP-ribosylglycohydrolase family protein [Aquisalimonas asiatica]SEO57530.1 ADP-ribosylglycohydrolase [Aquisalimonas asiatica]